MAFFSIKRLLSIRIGISVVCTVERSALHVLRKLHRKRYCFRSNEQVSRKMSVSEPGKSAKRFWITVG
jgi:hypothetical protein